MTYRQPLEQFPGGVQRSKLDSMPLKAPRKLPRRLNRETSVFSRTLARKQYQGSERRAQRRRERTMRFLRKFSKFSSIVASEFRAWLLIGVCAVIITVVMVLLFAPFFDVRQIHIRRQDPRIDLEDIQQTLSPLFKQRLLLVTKTQVSSLLAADYPDIDHVAITKSYPSTLTVSIFLQPVAAAIVIDDSDMSLASQSGAVAAGSGTYAYITRTGYFVSSPIKIVSGTPIPTLRLTDWGIRPQNRTRILSTDFIDQLFSARDALRTDFGLTTKDIVVYVRAQEFHIQTNKVTLWFDLKSPLSVQFQRFREFLKTLTLDQSKEYIDLRIADKIIYK